MMENDEVRNMNMLSMGISLQTRILQRLQMTKLPIFQGHKSYFYIKEKICFKYDRLYETEIRDR